MGRRRMQLGPEIEAEIAARDAAGETVKAIAAALGGRVSASTVFRRMRESRARKAETVCPTCGAPRQVPQ